MNRIKARANRIFVGFIRPAFQPGGEHRRVPGPWSKRHPTVTCRFTGGVCLLA